MPRRLLLLAFLLAEAPAGAVPAAAEHPSASASAWDWLGQAALEARHQRRFGRAVTLLRGAAAASADDPDVLAALADTYALAGLPAEAAQTYARLLERLPPADPRRARAKTERDRLEQVLAQELAPFVDPAARPVPAPEEARRAFADGQRLLRQNRLAEAIPWFEAAAFLDPDLPGPYRVLGGLYGRIGRPEKKVAFLSRYLQVKPEGAIAEVVRRELREAHAPLGRLTLESTFPCAVEVNGRALGRRTPLRGLELPAGRYLVTFDCEPYHLERHARAEVTPGKETTKLFRFGILKPELHPWARVRVDGRDQGLWDEIALPEGRHHVELRAHDGSHEKAMDIEVTAGKTLKIDKW